MGALNPRMIIKDIVSEPLVIHGKTDKFARSYRIIRKCWTKRGAFV